MLSMILEAFGSVSDSEFWVGVLVFLFRVTVVEEESSSSLSSNDRPALLAPDELEEERLGFGCFGEIEVLGLRFGVGSWTSEGFGLPQTQPALGMGMD